MNAGIHKNLFAARKYGRLDAYFFLRQTGSKYHILEVCGCWQFRNCGYHFFQRIVAKVRTGLKLISVDLVLGGQRNRKYNSDFSEVQILVLISISSVIERLRTQFLPISTRFLMWLGNMVGSMPIAFQTNRNCISDFRGIICKFRFWQF